MRDADSTRDPLGPTRPAFTDLYELTPLQQGMLFHARLEPESPIYVVQLSCSLCEMPRSQGVKIMAVGATRDT